MKKKSLHHIDLVHSLLLRVFGVCLGIICFTNIYLETHAEDLLESAFEPAKQQETIINLGDTKNAVGNEILRQGIVVQGGAGCTVSGELVGNIALKTQMETASYNGSISSFCTDVLQGSLFVPPPIKQAPLIVRIAKRLLRLTIVLSITMVIYNGVMYIVEASKGAEVKNATKNIGLIVGGILIALLSLGIINLISSITVSTLK